MDRKLLKTVNFTMEAPVCHRRLEDGALDDRGQRLSVPGEDGPSHPAPYTLPVDSNTSRVHKLQLGCQVPAKLQ